MRLQILCLLVVFGIIITSCKRRLSTDYDSPSAKVLQNSAEQQKLLNRIICLHDLFKENSRLGKSSWSGSYS